MNRVKKKLHQLLKARCHNGPINYRDYIDLVLYAPEVGYYTRNQTRVGRSPERDFYTSESLGRVFSELIADAATQLLGKERAQKTQFIEIAAEPGTALLDHLPQHPFSRRAEIRLGTPLQIEGPVVIFANEWLDALPFHRLIFHQGQWRERGVHLNPESNDLYEVLLPSLSHEVQSNLHRLPKTMPEAYQLDWPLPAEIALQNLLKQNWHGLLLFLDYGKTWQQLLNDHPQGTARTYHQHKQGSDLLKDPGEIDITCDICWDPLHERLEKAGFRSVTLESQESFLVRRAANAAAKIVSSHPGIFNTDRQTLMELIHPAHMGTKFQALWGLRDPQNLQ